MNAAPQIARHFGNIADTLDWPHPRWLALMARLVASGKDPAELTLGQVQAAIDATTPAATGKAGA